MAHFITAIHEQSDGSTRPFLQPLQPLITGFGGGGVGGLVKLFCPAELGRGLHNKKKKKISLELKPSKGLWVGCWCPPPPALCDGLFPPWVLGLTSAEPLLHG